MRGLLIGLLLAAGLGLSQAHADEVCPAATTELDDIVVSIKAAPDCAAAFNVMSACEFGASGDVSLAAAVESKCEPHFLGKLSRAKHRAYTAARKICDTKYANEEGTMYVSFAAFCDAELAVSYAKKYSGK